MKLALGSDLRRARAFQLTRQEQPKATDPGARRPFRSSACRMRRYSTPRLSAGAQKPIVKAGIGGFLIAFLPRAVENGDFRTGALASGQS